ncbi:UDP-galactopyranose mutase [Candidatus Methanosphaera massiliense]|uniref:UDP-galactopyranose mutase n=1 Tax=Methanosphaera TaxID=2316 RepID=UPI0023804350|nr:UDP-galactopyranose mutase [Candidatus Methanosphaera massiliense]MDE4078023.1 UDP-galactopyranose mutase [Candidatus Methanosphaera massiliense]MDY2745199.1 UDP-galactopyranose mutase [Methanosphaera sp.]
MAYDFIIVGAGIAGLTVAEQVANRLNKKVLLIDKRDHIGGNCYDYYNEEGILVHKYGPHIFHTDSIKVYKYLSRFTNWNIYNHKVVGKIDGDYVPLPFNLISIDKCMPEESEDIKTALLEKYNVNDKIPIHELKKSDDPNIEKLADYLYNEIYLNYTLNQWGYRPEELDSAIMEQLPLHLSYDCRYYQDIYQGVPTNGYAQMFQNMISNHNINILLEKDYHDVLNIDFENKKIYYHDEEFKGQVIFTGMIDEFFNFIYGRLPYRSLILMDETVDRPHFQDNATINYPNEYHFTRITEYKYITGQQSFKSAVQFEFPIDYNPNYPESNIPYYPIPREENQELYERYLELSEKFPQVSFIGRLAQYKNLNMDQVVKEALELVETKFLKEDTIPDETIKYIS